VNQFRNEGEGKFIRDHPFIKVLIVLDWSEFPIFLFDEEEAAGIG
jgi:hypothetical protein